MARPRKGPRLVRINGKDNWYVRDGRGTQFTTGTSDNRPSQKPAPRQVSMPRGGRTALDCSTRRSCQAFHSSGTSDKGAILQLTWDRVDLDKRRLDFNDPNRPITNKRRTLSPIEPAVVEMLTKAKTFAETNPVIEFNGKPLKEIKKGFALTAKKVGLKGATPHTLTHTAISWLAQAGSPIEHIAAMTATNANTVRRIYQKFAPEHLQDEAKILSNAISFTHTFAKPATSRQSSQVSI